MAKAVFHTTIIDTTTGLPVPNATVGIIDATSGLYAPLWSDRAGTVTVSPNPTTADANGFIEVYVTPGRFRIEADDGYGGTQTWEDELIGAPESTPLSSIDDGLITTAKLSDPQGIAGIVFGTVTGTDTYVFTSANADLATTSLEEGDTYKAKFPNTNTVVGATLDVDGIGPKTIVDEDGSPLTVGYVGTSKYLVITYDAGADSFRLEQEVPDVTERAVYIGEGTGLNNYTFTTSSGTLAATSYYDGMKLLATFAADNTGAVTIDVDGLGATSVVHRDGSALISGDINVASYYELTYDALSSQFFIGVPAHKRDLIGENQVWTDVTNSRSSDVIYTNNTGKSIMAYIGLAAGTSDPQAVQVRKDSGSPWVGVGFEGSSTALPNQVIIPNGHDYRVNGATISIWTELR